MIRKKKNDLPPVFLALIIDESGSMATCKDKSIRSFNEFVQDRRKEGREVSMKVWLTKFNTIKKIVCDGVDVAETPQFTSSNYRPDGGTALLDAVGSTIFALESRLASQKQRTKVMVMILTDGEENSSRYFDLETINNLISSKTAEGNWTFLFLGANQDSWETGQKMGITKGNSIDYSCWNIEAELPNISRKVSDSVYSISLNSLDTFGGVKSAEDLTD